MIEKEQKAEQHNHSHKKFFGGKILTGILLAIVLISLVVFLFITFAPVADNNKIEIAVLLPLTGKAADTGLVYQEGIDMAIAELLDNGNNIEITYYDTQGDPNIALDAFFDVVDSDIHAVLGPVSTGEAEVIAPYAEMYKIPMITYATGSSLEKYKNYVFRFDPSNNNFCDAIISLVREFNVSDLSVVWSETSLGSSSYNNLKEVAADDDIEIISIPITSIDDVIDTLNETKTEIAYVEAESAEQIHAIIEAQKRANLEYPLLWITSDSGFGDAIRDSSFDTSIFVLVPTVSTVDPIFLEKYKTTFNKEFDVSDGYLLYGYDSLMTLVSTFPTDPESDGEDIAENLKDYRYLGLTGPIFFNENLQRFPLYEVYTPAEGSWMNLPIIELIEDFEVILKPVLGH